MFRLAHALQVFVLTFVVGYLALAFGISVLSALFIDPSDWPTWVTVAKTSLALACGASLLAGLTVKVPKRG